MIRREADLRSCVSSDDCIIGRWHQGLAPSLFKATQRMYIHANTNWRFNRVDLTDRHNLSLSCATQITGTHKKH